MKARTWAPASFVDATYGTNAVVWWKWLTIRNGVQDSATVTHPPIVLPGTNASWTLVPDDDTLAYKVKWYWNGALDASFNNHFTFTRAMPVAGTYTARVDQILFDTTFTHAWSVIVPVNVTLTGNALVSNSVTNYYSASASGGTAAYSYQWNIDGSPFTTSSSFAAPYCALYSDHHLEVFVTDAIGATGYADIWVFVSTCDPEDSGCQVELRANPTPKKVPARATQPMSSSVPRASRRP